jgi:hypothetical protein
VDGRTESDWEEERLDVVVCVVVVEGRCRASSKNFTWQPCAGKGRGETGPYSAIETEGHRVVSVFR